MASVRALAAEQGLTTMLSAHAGSGILRAALRPTDESSGDGAMPGMAAAIELLRGEAAAVGGSLVIQEASPRLKERIDTWGRPGSGLSAMRRIKAEFDPQRLCSPGRFLGGI
jgi:glycolate oxidase FAD binding subunit